MTARRVKKVKKYPGSQTCRGGSRKKRRGSGNRGGRGKAGTGKRAKHKKFSVLKKFGLAYFGKHGFKRPQKVIQKENAITILDLPSQPTTLDLTKLGYTKLLSKGKPKQKYTLTINACSKRAKEKIEAAGGKVITKEVVTK